MDLKMNLLLGNVVRLSFGEFLEKKLLKDRRIYPNLCYVCVVVVVVVVGYKLISAQI